jgi:hypothetical protein
MAKMILWKSLSIESKIEDLPLKFCILVDYLKNNVTGRSRCMRMSVTPPVPRPINGVDHGLGSALDKEGPQEFRP